MKPVEQWKSRTFVVSLAVIAIITNGLVAPRSFDRAFQDSRQEKPLPPPAPTTTPDGKPTDHGPLIARNLNSRPTRTAGTKMVAIVAVTETDKLNSSLASALAEQVKSSNTKALTSLFTPEFVTEGLFKATFDDSPKAIDDLGLRDGLDMILLAQQSLEYTTNPSLENVLTASMTLEVKLVSVTQRGQSESWTFTSSGAGFKQPDARKAAEDRIIKQISTDTNILAAIHP